jgi:hypothetical protein
MRMIFLFIKIKFFYKWILKLIINDINNLKNNIKKNLILKKIKYNNKNIGWLN